MPRIAVFDSGLGSLSVIRELKKTNKASEIIYFADTVNFPYGTKSKEHLERIIRATIQNLKERFNPDVIIMASNTPTMVLGIDDGYYNGVYVMGVRPPLESAIKLSQTCNIGILGTTSGIKSAGLVQLIKEHTLHDVHNVIVVHRIDASALVGAVESGLFLESTSSCRALIRQTLTSVISKHNIDVATLSSTHLPFLTPLLQKEYPLVKFLNPAQRIAESIFTKYSYKKSDKDSLKIYATGNYDTLQDNLRKLGIVKTIEKF